MAANTAIWIYNAGNYCTKTMIETKMDGALVIWLSRRAPLKDLARLLCAHASIFTSEPQFDLVGVRVPAPT